jgi:hypothetical protein
MRRVKVPRASVVLDIYEGCQRAVDESVLITRKNTRDKEFHFQDWFQRRLADRAIKFDPPARNSYPDFRLVEEAVGFETKGLEYPGRQADFDCNSQVPSGFHNGRDVYYVFGRYPQTQERSYAVHDLVLCHGDLLNATRDYEHRNKSFRGFGSYGDILVRDRKMYVAPTPFSLLVGVERQTTLILPHGDATDDRFVLVGEFERVEVNKVVAGYSFDMTSNSLSLTYADNPSKGTRHKFRAYRLKGSPHTNVALRPNDSEQPESSDADIDGTDQS